MKLVEVINGMDSSAEALEIAQRHARTQVKYLFKLRMSSALL